jgi:hypothetical protein
VCAASLIGAAATLAVLAIGRKLQLHRYLNQSESLPIKPSLLLAVCNVVSAS